MKRETAWRVFASEYNDSTFEIKGEGEKTPSYVVTPLGAKVNRLFIVGVLTDVENISESGELLRAHLSDPTGVFTLYSGQYQQEATDALSNIEVPAFVAISGKSRTYSPEEGTLFVSVRPEKVIEVNADVRDQWILETCTSTKERIEAVFEAMKMKPANAYDMRKLGYSRDLSEGVVAALKNYGDVDLEKYITLIRESLQYIIPGKDTLPDLEVKEEEVVEEKELEVEEDVKEEASVEKPVAKAEEAGEKEEGSEEIEKTVLEVIKEIEGDDGASWDAITEKCEKKRIDRDAVEEALTTLMDKGLIYEPILGTIKTT
jgi:RPA family protein